MKKLFTVTAPAIVVALAASAALMECGLRLTWDPARGRPGLFMSDPVRTERLSARYDGWFAGVPVHTNALGFRDAREYTLEKGPRTFRILVLGDSVTFGHGSIYEHTYPYLLEQRLKAWRPEVEWAVWNLGVPGYNTTQELAYLLEVGPAYRPDLVVVGFFGNDVVENHPLDTPSRNAVVASKIKNVLRQNMYSFDWYRRAYLTLHYRLFASTAKRDLLENLAVQDRLLAKPAEVADLTEQRLTNPIPMTDAELESERCSDRQQRRFALRGLIEGSSGLEAWKATVRRFQELNRAGTYRTRFSSMRPRMSASQTTCSTRERPSPWTTSTWGCWPTEHPP